MQVISRVDNLGTRVKGTANASGGSLINAFSTSATTNDRQGVNISNHSTTDTLAIWVSQSSTAPDPSTVSPSHYLSPLSDRPLAYGGRCYVYVRSAGSNTVVYQITEML